MSLLDMINTTTGGTPALNLSATGNGFNHGTHITLPPISSIIKSMESTLPPLIPYPNQQYNPFHIKRAPITPPLPQAITPPPSSETLVINKNIPALLPSDSYNNYTYTTRSNSSSSVSSEVQQPSPPTISQPTPVDSVSIIKRKYTCKTCEKSFTTSGHLARHSRIHTGERKHICPFPNCQSRFARQDNCMQHYKTHLNNKLRKRKYNKRS